MDATRAAVDEAERTVVLSSTMLLWAGVPGRSAPADAHLVRADGAGATEAA
ncbi:MAG: hypothetical protein ACYC63_10005 [Armatimonadota bacterium]